MELPKSENDNCKTRTAATAPALVQQPGHIGSVHQLVSFGNSCLPNSVEVWNEGYSVPTSVREVAPDDRADGQDGWTGIVSCVPVTTAHITDAHQTSWIMVKPQDGSIQQMSSDHPVYQHAHWAAILVFQSL